MNPWWCDVYNVNQHFEFLLLPPPTSYFVPDVVQGNREFVLRIRGF
jgi:hypothetical protein